MRSTACVLAETNLSYFFFFQHLRESVIPLVDPNVITLDTMLVAQAMHMKCSA